MKALVYTGPNNVEIREAPAPIAKQGQCIVEVAYCGICGSDMHAYHGLDDRRIPPLVLGHEVSGRIASGRLSGKRVAINPLMTCGACYACNSGREHLCPARELIGMRLAGGFAQQVAISEKNLSVLPDGLPLERAALAEPLACAIHAVKIGLAQMIATPQQANIVVLGGGAIGLLAALVLRARAIAQLWIGETNFRRREDLSNCLDARTYDPVSQQPDLPVDLVIDAVGAGATRQAASTLVRPGGTIVHIGLQNSCSGLDTRRLTLQEIAFIGSYCYCNADFSEALAMLNNGTITGQGWSELRDLDDGPGAFQDIDAGRAPAKIVLKMR